MAKWITIDDWIHRVTIRDDKEFPGYPDLCIDGDAIGFFCGNRLVIHGYDVRKIERTGGDVELTLKIAE